MVVEIRGGQEGGLVVVVEMGGCQESRPTVLLKSGGQESGPVVVVEIRCAQEGGQLLSQVVMKVVWKWLLKTGVVKKVVQ